MGLLGKDVLGRVCVVRTPRTQYVGTVVGYQYKSGNYSVRIIRVIRGRKSVGEVITVKSADVYEE